MSTYPEPAVKYAGYSDLYFATEQQVRSWFALGNTDRGELTPAARRVTFRGMRVLVDCTNVTAIRLVKKTFPWAILLIVGAAAGVLVYLNSPVPFTWRQPLPYIILTILLVASVKQCREQWVEVVYAEGDQQRRAYFRRSPMFWGSGTARTRQLDRELRTAVLPAGAEPVPLVVARSPDRPRGSTACATHNSLR